MKIVKREILKCFKACINQYGYTKKKWFVDKKLKIIEQFHEVIQFDIKTTQGHIGLMRQENNVTMYIVFEGSDSKEKNNADWMGKRGNFNFKLIFPFSKKVKITNSRRTKIKVHAGHQLAWKDIKKFIFDMINKYKPKFIYVGGHSRGCSIAEIGAENIGFRFPNIKVFYIGMSGNRVGNSYFIESLHQHTEDHIKVWIKEDPVPKVPWPIFGHRHPYIIRKLKSETKAVKWFWWLRFINPFGWPGDHYPDEVLKSAKKQL